MNGHIDIPLLPSHIILKIAKQFQNATDFGLIFKEEISPKLNIFEKKTLFKFQSFCTHRLVEFWELPIIDGSQLNKEFMREFGLREPIKIQDMKGVGFKLPDGCPVNDKFKALTYVKNAIGANTTIEFIDVIKQLSVPYEMDILSSSSSEKKEVEVEVEVEKKMKKKKKKKKKKKTLKKKNNWDFFRRIYRLDLEYSK